MVKKLLIVNYLYIFNVNLYLLENICVFANLLEYKIQFSKLLKIPRVVILLFLYKAYKIKSLHIFIVQIANRICTFLWNVFILK